MALGKFEASLVCVTGSRTVRATGRDADWTNKTRNKKSQGKCPTPGFISRKVVPFIHILNVTIQLLC